MRPTGRCSMADSPVVAEVLELRSAEVGEPVTIQTWKLSTDPQFIEKVRDVVGLYVAPPEHALVLCGLESSSPILRFSTLSLRLAIHWRKTTCSVTGERWRGRQRQANGYF
jgi:hypothetical protein